MSYDIYSYRPSTTTPSTEEALAVISSEENSVFRDDEEAKAIKHKIAAALVGLIPKLETFKIDYERVCELRPSNRCGI